MICFSYFKFPAKPFSLMMSVNDRQIEGPHVLDDCEGLLHLGRRVIKAIAQLIRQQYAGSRPVEGYNAGGSIGRREAASLNRAVRQVADADRAGSFDQDDSIAIRSGQVVVAVPCFRSRNGAGP